MNVDFLTNTEVKYSLLKWKINKIKLEIRSSGQIKIRNNFSMIILTKCSDSKSYRKLLKYWGQKKKKKKKLLKYN